MDDMNREYDSSLGDIITAKPHEFSVGRKHLRIYPVTLAKMYMLRPYMVALAINKELLTINPHFEALRATREHRNECCSVLSIYTSPNTYKDLHNTQAFAMRRNLLNKASDEDLATLLLVVLTADKTEELVKYLGLDKEQERMANVMKVKKENGKNNVTFGGITIFGSFVGQLKEMGYTDDEILFERPYGFLRLMLADKTVSIYLSDDELQNLTKDDGGTMIDGNSPDAYEALKGRLAGKLKFKD